MKLSKYEYREALFYLASGAALFFVGRAIPAAPLGLSLVFALGVSGWNPFVLAAEFALGSLVEKDPRYFLACLVAGACLAAILAVYRKKKAGMGAESLLYLLVSLAFYVAYGSKSAGISMRAAYAGLTVLLCYLTAYVCHPLFLRKLHFQPNSMQLFSALIFAAVFGTGVYRYLGKPGIAAISCGALLFFTYYFRAAGALFSVVSVLPQAVLTGNYAVLGVFFLYAVAVAAASSVGRAAQGAAVLGIYAALSLAAGVAEFSLPVLISYGAVALFYVLVPKSVLERGAEALASRREKTLTRAAINRDHARLSAKLTGLASVFREIEALFSVPAFYKRSEEKDAEMLASETMENVCVRCKNHETCIKNGELKESDVKKAIAIGLTKGRVSMLDLPKNLMQICLFPNNLLFGANQLISRYMGAAYDRENAETGRKLVGAEAGGVAEVLENLSASVALPYSYDRKKERVLYETLAEKGVFPAEVMVKNDGAVSLILEEADVKRLPYVTKRLSRAVGREMVPAEAQEADRTRTMVSFTSAPRYDAAFGIAAAKKEGSERSGDTYSVLRLGTDGFLVAVSDGMGSGEEANAVSSSAMTLIESFYRAGFCSDVILKTVNKLLSAKAEESFAALDVCTLSLSSGRCDFIKIGAPYGFVLKEAGVSLVQGNSLPLGILDDIRPEVSSDTLTPGDVLVLASDGVTDAFASDSDFLDFLKNGRRRNPQELAESVLKQAKILSGGVLKDDMTVLCVRMFEKEGAENFPTARRVG